MKTRILLAMVLAVTLLAGTANAALIQYQFTFTGADMLNNVFVDGNDDTSAGDNDLFDGARLLRVDSDADHADAARTYVESQHGKFEERWDDYADAGYVFDEFNLWGLNGRGEHWGEDYKPTQWLSASGPAGWSTENRTWPASWGTPPAGAITNEFPKWQANTQADALSMTDPNLADKVFSVDLLIDTTEAWWGGATGNALNSLDDLELTIWFGGWLTQYDEFGNYSDYHLYEGNMVLSDGQVSVVPEPATMALLGLGLGGLALSRIRRRKAA